MADLLRLVWYVTKRPDKYEADKHPEYLGSFEHIRMLWTALDLAGWPHLEIYTLSGSRLDPSNQMCLWRENDRQAREETTS